MPGHIARLVPSVCGYAATSGYADHVGDSRLRLARREATGVQTEGVIARRGCRLGASAVLLPGVELGVECLVGAGAVVTRAVPDQAVAVGVPARVIGAVDPVELLDASASGALERRPSTGP